MTHHKILYNCKICGRPGVAMASLDCSQEWIDKLAPMICCNPCGDAREKRRAAEEKIFKACHMLNHATQFPEPGQVRATARQMLDSWVPRFASAVCDGLRVTLVYDRDFAEGFYRSPENAGKRMAFYKNSMADIAAETHKQAALEAEKVFL